MALGMHVARVDTALWVMILNEGFGFFSDDMRHMCLGRTVELQQLMAFVISISSLPSVEIC